MQSTTTAASKSSSLSSSTLPFLDEDELGIPPKATLHVGEDGRGAAVLRMCDPATVSARAAAPESEQNPVGQHPLIPIGPGLLLGGANQEGGRYGCRRCILVGRQAGLADLRIQHGSISRKHAALFYQRVETTMDDTTTTGTTTYTGSDQQHSSRSSLLYILDFGGKHGTTVNHVRLLPHTVTPLHEGDLVMFGIVRDSVFQVTYPSGDRGDFHTTSTPHTTRVIHRSLAPTEQEAAFTQREQPDTASQAASGLGAASPTPLIMTERDVVVEQAGEGLTGRAKRLAEIDAVMATLDENPTYEPYKHPEIESTEATTNTASFNQIQEQQQQRQQQEFALPLTQTFSIPSESHRRSAITCLSVDPTGSRFVVGATDTYLRFYDFGGLDRTRPEAFRAVIPDDGHPLADCCYSSTGDRIIVATSGVQPIVLDRDGHEIIQFVRGDMYVLDPTKTVGHTGAVTSVHWHPLERDCVLTASADGSARTWDLNGPTQFHKLVCDRVFPVKNMKGQRTAVLSCCFHPGGRELAVGTACGSIQIWNRDRKAHRPDRVVLSAHGDDSNSNKPVTSISYNGTGSQLASRSASHENTIKIWEVSKMGRANASTPIFVCDHATTIFDKANMCFSPDGQFLCAGVSILNTTSGERPQEMGGLHVYALGAGHQLDLVQPVVAMCMDETQCTPVTVHWHPKLNQIFVGCSDGRVLIWYDLHLSAKGVLLPLSRPGRSANPLSEIIQARAASAVIPAGDIVTPFAQPRVRGKQLADDLKKRKRQDLLKSREPERPATGKQKAVSQTGGSLTFAQFVADQGATESASKVIAGKDPRAALFQYGAGTDARILAEKTAEQEEEELKAMKKL